MQSTIFAPTAADEWPDEWKAAVPLPELYLATREYVEHHGKPPSGFEDLSDIVVPSWGHVDTVDRGRQKVLSRIVRPEMGRDMLYFPSHLNLRTIIEDDQIVLAVQRSEKNPHILQVIHWSGRVEQLPSAAVREVLKEQARLSAAAR